MPSIFYAFTYIYRNVEEKSEYNLDWLRKAFKNMFWKTVSSSKSNDSGENYYVPNLLNPIIKIFKDYKGINSMAINTGFKLHCSYDVPNSDLNKFINRVLREGDRGGLHFLINDRYKCEFFGYGLCDDHSYIQNEFSSGLLVTGPQSHDEYIWVILDKKVMRKVNSQLIFTMFSEENVTLPSKKDKTLTISKEKLLDVLKKANIEIHSNDPAFIDYDHNITSENYIPADMPDGESIRTIEGNARCMVFSPDDKFLITGSETMYKKDDEGYAFRNFINIYEIDTGKLARSLESHDGTIHSIAVSPDGKLIVSGSENKKITIWRFSDGKLLKTLRGFAGRVSTVSVTPSGRFIISGSGTHISGSKDTHINIWDLKSGELLKTLYGHKIYINSVKVTSDSQFIVSGSSDQTIKIWDIKTGNLVKNLLGHKDYVNSVAISNESNYIVSGSGKSSNLSKDRTIKIWNLRSGKLIRTIKNQRGYVKKVLFTPKNNIASCADKDNDVRIYEFSSGKLIQMLKGNDKRVETIAISNNGNYLVSSYTYGKIIRIWELNN